MTKRKPNNELRTISTSWPIFNWAECVSCKMEFRRVKMYAKFIGPYREKWRFICPECAKTKQEAFDLFDKHYQLTRSGRPQRTTQILPPPPPRGTKLDTICGDVTIKITPIKIPPPPPRIRPDNDNWCPR